MANQASLRTRVLLSLQRALLGEITPAMRAVAVQWSPQQINIRVYTDGEVHESVCEDFDASVVTQVMGDFLELGRVEPDVTYEFVRSDAPAAMPNWGDLVFARADARFGPDEQSS